MRCTRSGTPCGFAYWRSWVPPGERGRYPVVSVMRLLVLLLIVLNCKISVSDDAIPRTVIYLLDPRNATYTEETMATENGDSRTDIIASRTLTASEAKDLAEIMDAELLTGGGNFCGHRPAWAIREYVGNELKRSVTICASANLGGQMATYPP